MITILFYIFNFSLPFICLGKVLCIFTNQKRTLTITKIPKKCCEGPFVPANCILPVFMFRSGYATHWGELLQEREGEQGGLGRLHQDDQEEHKPERRGRRHHGCLKGLSILCSFFFEPYSLECITQCNIYKLSSSSNNSCWKVWDLFQNHNSDNTEQHHQCEMFSLNVMKRTGCDVSKGGGQSSEDADLVSDQRNEEHDWRQENPANLQDERQT